MHRHGYQGRKLRRERDQRRALIKGLATSLIEYGSIETTLPKAKEVVPYVEVLITKAKKGDLHNRRQVIAALSTLDAAYKLVDEIAPQLSGRTSGHLRIKRTRARVGDNAQLARISFVDELTATPAEVAVVKKATKPAVKKAAVKRSPVASKTATGKPVVKKGDK
jgi:large subunit ribosomal protein L17